MQVGLHPELSKHVSLPRAKTVSNTPFKHGGLNDKLFKFLCCLSKAKLLFPENGKCIKMPVRTFLPEGKRMSPWGALSSGHFLQWRWILVTVFSLGRGPLGEGKRSQRARGMGIGAGVLPWALKLAGEGGPTQWNTRKGTDWSRGSEWGKAESGVRPSRPRGPPLPVPPWGTHPRLRRELDHLTHRQGRAPSLGMAQSLTVIDAKGGNQPSTSPVETGKKQQEGQGLRGPSSSPKILLSLPQTATPTMAMSVGTDTRACSPG